PFVIAYSNSQRVKGAYEYFTHKNDPEKAQYSETDIELFNGFDINDFKSLKELALYKKAMLNEIFSFVELNELISFRALMSYAKEYRPEWFEFLTESHSYIVINFIKSMSWEKEKRIDFDISKLKELPTE
ncbi:plasmid replication protein, partial [Helicobacter pylori GAM96Ai]|uniref:Rep family protein n=1 Tax=Helicobacter pylori TaxID=210 RepID=UPI0002BBE017